MQGERKTEKQFIKVFGDIVKGHRNKVGKTIYLISAESSIAKSNWRELEFGLRKDINLSTFCKIAEGLDMKPYELLKELCEKLGDDFSFTDINS